jgi:hypothetical protein
MREAKVSREEQMERENEAFLAIQREAKLRGTPSGEQRCDNCKYYVGEWKKIAYCNHPKLQLLVGAQWWCQWWEAKEG